MTTTTGPTSIFVTMDGNFDMESAPEIRKSLLDTVKKNPGELTLDLSSAPLLDTAAIAVLVEIYNVSCAAGVKFRLLGLSERASRVIKLANLETVFLSGCTV